MNIKKKLLRVPRLLLPVLLLAVGQSAFGSVSITGATGGTTMLADTAANATSPAWTTLGSITIAENLSGDFSSGSGVTLVLKAPAGFQFNTAVTPSISFTASRNITSAAIAVTDSSTLTITLTVSGTGSSDTLLIGAATGIQVRPSAGTPLVAGNHIYRPTTGGGTATISGITTSSDGSGGSNFGNLSELAGAPIALAFTTQPAGATAGAAFTTQPVVRAQDQFGNTATNGFGNNVFVTVALTAGTGPLQGTASVNMGMSAGKGTATYAGLRIDVAGSDKQFTVTSTNGLTSATSSVFSVNPAAVTQLAFITTPSSTATAGTLFAQQPVIQAKDTFGNLVSTNVTAARNAGAGTLQGTLTVATVNGLATFTDLSHLYATNITITFTAGNISTNSGTIAVSAGAYSQLLPLLPNESQVPASATGRSGSVTAQNAGSAFAVRVIAVDDNWNTVTSVTDTVGLTSSDANATLPSNAALINGTNTLIITCRTAGSRTVTANDITDGVTTGLSSSVTINATAATKLQILVPGETAVPGSATGKTGSPTAQTAGSSYTVTVNSVDANWNPVSSTHSISITSSDANSTLPASANLSGGTRNFAITNKTVGTWTVTATDGNGSPFSPNTSSSITVNGGAFAKLQILAPGETAAPGTATGKTSSPTAQNIDTPFNVTVNAVDSNWNLINTVSDTVAITSSDANAALPANAALSSGTQTFSVKFNTSGSRTVTATDASDGTKTANTSASITVNNGAFAKLQVLMPGESAAPGTLTGTSGSPTAQTAGTAFNVTVRAVDASWNLISTNDMIHLTSSDAQAVLAANGPLTAGSGTFSVTLRTTASQTVSASDVTHGGIASDTGTATTVNPAAASKLVIVTQPSSTATAAVPFSQQPVIFIEDQFNNIRSNDSLTITAYRIAGAGVLVGSTNVAAVNGVASYSNLAHLLATNITISFSNNALTMATSTVVAVSSGPIAQLQVLLPGDTAAPGTPAGKTGTPSAQTAGTAFNATIRAVDAGFNLLTNITDVIGISSSDSNAVLGANLALVNGSGVISLNCKTAGNQTVTANDLTDGVTTGTSASVTVNPGAFVKLQTLAPGETAAPGTATGKTGTPTAQTANVQLNVIVNGVDANWNIVPAASGGSFTIHITSSDANATLPSNANLLSGTQTFPVTLKTGGAQTATATDIDDGTKTSSTTATITVNAAAFAKLQLLMPGEIAAPGTSTGKTGTPNTQMAGSAFSVTVSAVDANWNVVSTNDTVHITSSDASADLPIDAALVSGSQTFSVTFNTAGSRTVTASDFTHAGITANTSPATTVTSGAFSKLQILLPGETAAPGTVSGKTGTPTAQTSGTAFNVTVNAVDDNWNLVNTITHNVGITSSDSSATLPSNNTLSAGSRTFSVTLRTGGSSTVTASDITDPTKTASTSPSVVVNVGAFAKLQLLVPGETAAPGTTTGKTGTPTATTAGSSFSVTVNAVDANWNLISTNDTIRIYSSDTNSVLPSNAALVSGSRSFAVTLRTIPSQTITASNVTHSAITLNTSPAITVNPAAATVVRVETSANGSGTVVSAQSLASGSSLTAYSIARDSFGNFIGNIAADAWSLPTKTGGVVDSDLVPAGDNKSAVLTGNTPGTAVIRATSTGLTGTDSGTITVTAGPFVKMQVLLPGETAAVGTPSGKTGTATAQTAGVGFSVTINAVDANWNIVNTNDTVRIQSTDANAILPANTALVSGTRTLTATNRTAGSWIITGSNVTHAGITSGTDSYTVNVGAFAKLQLLMPGETASAGSTTGKTGSPTTQTAGNALNVTVNAVDANWNLIDTVTDTIDISSSDANATLPADAALVAGTQTFSVTFKTSGTRTVTATDVTDGTKTANTGASTTVNAGAFAKLQLLVPGETAAPGTATGKTGTPSTRTAGTAFNVTINAVDANWNPVTSATGSSYTMQVTSSDANATLPSNANLFFGTLTTSVTLKTGGTATITATDVDDGTKTPNTSPSITVNSGALAKLQLLVPGETAAPGTATGKTGTPSSEVVGTAFDITVNAVDANWNVVNTNDTVRFTSTDANATLPANSALIAGSQTLSVTLMSAGSRTITASNLTHTAVSGSTSPAITVGKGSQTIAFSSLANKSYGDPSFAVSATASSGLSVSFSIASGPATVAGSTVSLTGAGSVTVRASQAGDANWNAATNVDQSFSVSAASLTVGAADARRGYGAANPNLIARYFGFVNSDTTNALSGAPILSTLADTNSPTGDYPIVISTGTLSNSNYSFVLTNGTLTVTQAVVTVAANNQTRVYGDANPALTVSYSGFVNGQDTNILTGAPDVSTSTDLTNAVGTYPIVVSLGTLAVSDTNYSLAFVNGSLSVTAAPLSITADSKLRIYGISNPALTGTLVGVKNADNITDSYSTTATAASPVGPYVITASLNDPDNNLGNYSVTTNNGTLTISAAPLTVTADSKTRGYGVINPVLTGTLVGVQNGDNITDSYSTTATASSPVGPYVITASLNDPNNKLSNYAVTSNNGTLTVTPASLTGTADNKSRAYGATNPVFTVTYTGFVNSEDSSVVTGTLVSSTTADTNSPIGTYPITVSGQSAPNYNIAFVDGTLTVAAAELLVQADNKSRAYGATNSELTATITGFVNGESTNNLDGALVLTTLADTNSPMGTYPIEVSGVTATNYSITFSNGTLTVTPFALTIAADNQTRSYGAANPTLTGSLTGIQNGDNITGSYSTIADTNSVVGSYDIIPALADPDNKLTNYSVTISNGTLAVTPAALAIAADDKNRTYGDVNPALTGTLVGVQNNENISGNYATVADSSSPVGPYVITASLNDPDNKLGNYSVTTNNGTLTVTPASLVGTADNKMRVYGATNPVFTVTYTGFVNSEDSSIVTGALLVSTTADTNSPVDVYSIVASGQSALNYSITYVDGKLTVTPADLLIEADNKSRAYGATNPALTATITGFVNGENANNLQGALILSTVADTNSPMGTYPIEVSGVTSTNYSITFSNGTLTVTSYALTIVADNQTRTYGAANPTFTGSLTGVQNGDNITGSYSTIADTNSPIGSYDIVTALADPDNKLTNYSVTISNGTLTVTPATLVITADDKNRIYGVANPALTGTLVGVQNSENITGSYTTAADSSSSVGTYPITASLNDPDNKLSNYSITTNNGTLTIEAAPLTVTADSTTRAYGDVNPALTGTLDGVQNGDNITDSYSTTATAASPVGPYVITATLNDPDNKLSNYAVTANNGTLTVTPASLTGTADNMSRPYGATNPVFTVTYTGFVNSEDSSVVTGTLIGSTIADTNSPVGMYSILVSGQSAPNYDITFVNGKLTVTPVDLLIQAENKSRAYGATNPELTATITGFVNGETTNVLAGSLLLSTVADTNSPMGTYPIEVSGVTSTNYSITFSNGTLTVTSYALTIVADNQTRTYGAANPTFTGSLTGVQNGDNITGSYSTIADTNSPIGSYDIVTALADPDNKLTNYSVTISNGTLTVTPATLVITADDKNRIYGVANPALTGTLVGVQNSENITGSYTTAADSSSSVGTYPITASLNDPDNKLSNYSITTNNGTLTIEAAPLTVTADSTTRAYGDVNPALTGTLDGVQNGDNITDSYSTTATAASPVGPYVITATLNDPDNKLSNYAVTANNGTLTVTPASLTGTADNMSRPYGATNPVFTVTYTGFVNSEDSSVVTGTLIGSTIADTNSPVGMYSILVSGQSAPNYDITFVNGKLTVTPVDLLIQAENKSRAYGATNPALTATITGFVNGESSSNLAGALVLSTVADTNSPLGTYPIEASGLTSANYSITFTNGTLTVTPYALTIVADNQNRAYGTVNPTLTGSLTGVQNGDNITGSYATVADTNSAVGSYDIVPALVDPNNKLTNYSVTISNGTLSVTPATLIITADDKNRTYGAANPALTGTLVGVQNSENITGSYTMAADSSSSVGTYPITASLNDPGNMLGNYSVTTNNGTLTIEAAPLTVTADSKTRVYGDVNPALTGTLVGVQNSDNITASYSTIATAASPVGNYPITASLNDPDNKFGNYSVTTNDAMLTINPAALAVIADDKTRVYGAPNPALTAHYAGFVNGENQSVLSGAPGLNTAANASSTVAGGPYTITASIGSLSATNYSFFFTNGQLTVTAAGSTLAITTSANPSPTGSNVTFTATLAAISPSTAIPAGSVQFVVDGVPFAAPAPIVSGVATLSTSALAHGSRQVTAQYLSDGNFLASSNTLSPDELINSSPVAGEFEFSVPKNQSTNILASQLVLQATDPDSDTMTITSVSAASAQGGTVSLSGGIVTYTPAADYIGVDSFTYVVSDSFGATDTGTVGVTVTQIQVPAVLSNIAKAADGNIQFQASGTPKADYYVQASTNFINWSTIGTNTASTNGIILFVDRNSTNYTSRFYRLALP